MAQLPARFLNFQLGTNHLSSVMYGSVSEGTNSIKDFEGSSQQMNVKRIEELNSLLATEARRLHEELSKGMEKTELIQRELALFAQKKEPQDTVAGLRIQRNSLLSNIDKLNDTLLRLVTEKEQCETKIEHLEDSVRQQEEEQHLLLARVQSLEEANSRLSDTISEHDNERQDNLAHISILEEANSELRKSVNEHKEMHDLLHARIHRLEEENGRLKESVKGQSLLLNQVQCLEDEKRELSDHVCLLLSDIEQLYNKARQRAVGLDHLDEVNRLKSERQRIVRHAIKMEKITTKVLLNNKFLRYQMLQLEEDVDRRVSAWAVDVENTVLQRLQGVETRIETVDESAVKTLKRNEEIYAAKMKQLTAAMEKLCAQLEIEKKNAAKFQSEKDLQKNQLEAVKKELEKEVALRLQVERDESKRRPVTGENSSKDEVMNESTVEKEKLKTMLEETALKQKETMNAMSKLQSEKDKLKKKLEDSECQKKSFQLHVNKSQSERDHVKNKLAETEKRKTEIMEENNKLQAAAEKAKSEMATMTDRIMELERRVEEKMEMESNSQCVSSRHETLSKSPSPTFSLESAEVHTPTASIIPASVLLNLGSHAFEHRFPNIFIFDHNGPHLFIIFNQRDRGNITVCSLRSTLETYLIGRTLRLYLTTARSVVRPRKIHQVWDSIKNGLCQWKFASLDGEEFYDTEYTHRNTSLLTNDLQSLKVPKGHALWIYIR